MFRTAEGHTHLLDEVDSWKSKDDLRDLLNAGFKKGGIVARCDKGKGGAFKPTPYSVYAPRALAGIGISILHSTTLDRTFALPMVRQKRNEKRERSRERIIGPQAKELKLKIENWVKKNENAVAQLYDKQEFPALERFADRTIDIAEPLLAIVQIAYQGHSAANKSIKDLVHAIEPTRKRAAIGFSRPCTPEVSAQSGRERGSLGRKRHRTSSEMCEFRNTCRSIRCLKSATKVRLQNQIAPKRWRKASLSVQLKSCRTERSS